MLYRNGWQDSEVATKYVYRRLTESLDMYKRHRHKGRGLDKNSFVISLQ